MKHYSLKKTEWISFVIACILGTLFHFFYEWSGGNPIAGLFFPINESTWEHLKLLFFPILFLIPVEYFLFGIRYQNFLFVKFLSALLGMIFIVVMFYTYTGIFGKNNDVMNILIFFIAMALSYYFSYRWIREKKMSGVSAKTGFRGFVFLTLLFFLFSMFPPKIGLFIPPA